MGFYPVEFSIWLVIEAKLMATLKYFILNINEESNSFDVDMRLADWLCDWRL